MYHCLITVFNIHYKKVSRLVADQTTEVMKRIPYLTGIQIYGVAVSLHPCWAANIVI